MAEKDKLKDVEKRLAGIDEEHKDMVYTLVKQKEELKNQRDQLKQLRTKVEKLVEDNESKLQSVEKDITDEDKGFTSAPKHKDIIYNNNWDLKDRVRELDTMVLNTEKLLGMTEDVIVKTTKKKETEKQIHEE